MKPTRWRSHDVSASANWASAIAWRRLWFAPVICGAVARFDSREAADAFVDALPAVTHRSLGAALQKRVQNAKVAHGEAFLKELRKRLSLDHGEERAVGWALVRRGLVERQSPPLWRVLADHIGAYPDCASVDDVVLLLSGISDPGEDLGGTIRSFPHWSASLDEICFVICGADLAVLRELWRASTGRARIGLTGLLYRGGVLSAQELAEDSDANDWAQLLGRHFRETPRPSALIWPTHPAATSREWRPAWYRCVELWESEAGDWTAAFHDLIDGLSNRRAFAAAFSSVELATPAQPISPLAAPKAHPGARSRKALKGQLDVI